MISSHSSQPKTFDGSLTQTQAQDTNCLFKTNKEKDLDSSQYDPTKENWLFKRILKLARIELCILKSDLFYLCRAP